MISATAMTEASNKGQMGQPAAWIMANKMALRGLWFLLSAHFSKKAERALSTFPVDKFVDFLWAAHGLPRARHAKSVAIKNSSILSGTETAAYEIESGSVRDRRAPL
ncbi:MAG TPA: hypothetical protein VLA30_14120 [Burkholderiales bacterium]|nr:hypothetical protein [Burkholderiales bacterium]